MANLIRIILVRESSIYHIYIIRYTYIGVPYFETFRIRLKFNYSLTEKLIQILEWPPYQLEAPGVARLPGTGHGEIPVSIPANIDRRQGK